MWGKKGRFSCKSSQQRLKRLPRSPDFESGRGVKANDVSSTKQIINLERFYPKLILAFKKEANLKTLREIDKAYFQYKIPETKDLPK